MNKPKVQSNSTAFDIYTYCDWPKNPINAKLASEPQKDNLKRLILKTDNSVAANLSIKARRSLLKKCKNMMIRTDLQNTGVYIMKDWLIR